MRFWEGWPPVVTMITAMALLAALDLGGAYAAKEAVERRSWGFAVVGAAMFLLLFLVYVAALEVAELVVVTLGWIVLLQLGVVAMDRMLYHSTLPRGWPIAVAVIIAALGYLMVGPKEETPPVSTLASIPVPREGRALEALPQEGRDTHGEGHASPRLGENQVQRR